jgi:hypothetical protein
LGLVIDIGSGAVGLWLWIDLVMERNWQSRNTKVLWD